MSKGGWVGSANLEGFDKLFRVISFQRPGASVLQLRCLASGATGKYLFYLPGSVDACETGGVQIQKAQFDAETRPCNFVQILGR